MFLLIDEAIAVVYDDSNFNTSHVSINQDTENGSAPAGVISIHLMFLLIGFSCSSVFSFLHYFNTSHVSINRGKCVLGYFCRLISIHLMFLLIREPISCTWASRKISIHLMFLLISPVIVTPVQFCTISIHLMFLLIEYLEAQGDPQKNFNTSHVSINLFRAGCPCTTNFNFNTSHVSIDQFQA